MGHTPGISGARRGRRVVAVLATLAGVAAVVVPALPSEAAFSGTKLSGSNFEIDTNANLVVDGASPSIDWLTGGSGTALRSGVSSKPDVASGSGDDSFGQGAKEDSAVPAVVDGSIPPNKSDLKRFGVFKEGEQFLHLFWSRVQDPSGTTNMDFEFNQSQTLSANGVTPVRTEGDLLITYDLANGGTVAVLSKRTWSGSEWGDPTALTGNAIGSINTTAIPASAAGAVGALSARTFGEASIDMTAIFDSAECTSFGSAYLKSRSSDAFTAALKDFIAPESVSITNCGSVNIHKKDDADNNLGGATFTLYTDNAPLDGAAPHGAGDTATTLTCTTANTTGNCTIANVPFGQYWVVETTTPAGYQTAADQNIILAAGSATASLTFTDNRDRSFIVVNKTDDDSPANPVNGAVFTAYVDVAPIGGSKGAGDTVSAGTCTIVAGTCTISNLLLGDYWVVETTTPTGYTTAANQHATLTAVNAGTGVTLNFVDQREFKVIVIVCRQTDNSLYQTPITIDGTSAGNSITSPPGTATAAQVCAITDGARGGLHYGSHTAGANIPQ